MIPASITNNWRTKVKCWLFALFTFVPFAVDLCCGSSPDTLALPWKASLAWHIDFWHSRYRNQGTPSSPKSITGPLAASSINKLEEHSTPHCSEAGIIFEASHRVPGAEHPLLCSSIGEGPEVADNIGQQLGADAKVLLSYQVWSFSRLSPELEILTICVDE
jgi:hypothetical protein